MKMKITSLISLCCQGISFGLVFSSVHLFNTNAFAIPDDTELKSQLLTIKFPDLPSLNDLDKSLYFPDRVYPVKLVLRLSKRQVEVYEGDDLITSFPVAVGKKGWETPTGEFEIIQMVKNPSWQNPWTGKVIPPSPNNPLGERWIGFWSDGKNFIGFHGTPGEHLIGQAVSHGCVRMKNKDIKQLFELVSMGIPVTVVK